VALAPIREPRHVPPAIQAVVDPGQPPSARVPLDALKHSLHERHLLLVLDNFEQVIDAAPVVAELLAACPSLKIIATSRAPLHVSWERVFIDGPLEVPRAELNDDLEQRFSCSRVGRVG